MKGILNNCNSVLHFVFNKARFLLTINRAYAKENCAVYLQLVPDKECVRNDSKVRDSRVLERNKRCQPGYPFWVVSEWIPVLLNGKYSVISLHLSSLLVSKV